VQVAGVARQLQQLQRLLLQRMCLQAALPMSKYWTSSSSSAVRLLVISLTQQSLQEWQRRQQQQ
jgi:hypothetical protein